MATLTSRTGMKLKAKVTLHTPIHGEARTACGMTFAALAAQEFAVHQTSAAADLSDVKCHGCRPVFA